MRRVFALGLVTVLILAAGGGYYAGSRHLLAPAPADAATTTADCLTFAETGKAVCDRFLDYWQQHGGLAQQGLPLTNVFAEASSLDGKIYRVQYFERAVFELHPENAPPYDVLITLLARERFLVKYPNGDPSVSQPSPTPFAKYTAAHVAAAFEFAGLTVASMEDGLAIPGESWPMTHSEWKVFGTAGISYTVRGGQILTYATPEAMQAMLDWLATVSGYPEAYHAFSHANVIVLLSPYTSSDEAIKYKAALESLR